MKPNNYIRDIAKIETKKLKVEIGDGFRGGIFPLPIPGWFIRLDHTCTCKTIVFDKDNIKADYSP